MFDMANQKPQQTGYHTRILVRLDLFSLSTTVRSCDFCHTIPTHGLPPIVHEFLGSSAEHATFSVLLENYHVPVHVHVKQRSLCDLELSP